MALEKRPHAGGERGYATLGLRTIRSTLTADHEPMVPPVEIVFPEVGQLRDAEAGIEQGPDYELFLMRLAGVGEAIGLIRR
jgi:hypothetical protein